MIAFCFKASAKNTPNALPLIAEGALGLAEQPLGVITFCSVFLTGFGPRCLGLRFVSGIVSGMTSGSTGIADGFGFGFGVVEGFIF